MYVICFPSTYTVLCKKTEKKSFNFAFAKLPIIYHHLPLLVTVLARSNANTALIVPRKGTCSIV